MTSYEILTLIISVVAIIASIGIPLAGYLHKRLQKPSLDIYEFEYQPLVLMFSTLGNRIKLNFSILCKKAPCVIRSIEADIFFEANAKQIKMRWVIMEPIRLDWANGMGSVINLNSMTLTHPFLIDADTLVPLSVQFEPIDNSEFIDAYNRRFDLSALEITEVTKGNKLCKHFEEISNHNSDLDILSRQLSKLCFWECGRYKLHLRLTYDANKVFEKDFHFTLTADEATMLQTNAEKMLVCDQCSKNTNPQSAQCVAIPKDVESWK